MKVKPISYNTEMVRAILDGNKTATRRLIKIPPEYRKEYQSCWKDGYFIEKGKLYFEIQTRVDDSKVKEIKPKYQPNDILYVRETWRKYNGKYYYKADEPPEYDGYFTKKLPCAPKWKPSIHMPKEAARIWLKVTDVRVERLRDITWGDGYGEGLENPARFNELWDSTIKKKDLPLYGWDANPWVWVIEFERCEKPGNEV